MVDPLLQKLRLELLSRLSLQMYVSRLIISSPHASLRFLARLRALEDLVSIFSIWLVSHTVGGYPTRT